MKDKKHQYKGTIYIKPVWLKQLEKRLIDGFGKRCKDFSFGCFSCMAWLAFDILNDLYGWKDET